MYHDLMKAAVELQKATGLTITLCLYLLKLYGAEKCLNIIKTS